MARPYAIYTEINTWMSGVFSAIYRFFVQTDPLFLLNELSWGMALPIYLVIIVTTLLYKRRLLIM